MAPTPGSGDFITTRSDDLSGLRRRHQRSPLVAHHAQFGRPHSVRKSPRPARAFSPNSQPPTTPAASVKPPNPVSRPRSSPKTPASGRKGHVVALDNLEKLSALEFDITDSVKSHDMTPDPFRPIHEVVYLNFFYYHHFLHCHHPCQKRDSKRIFSIRVTTRSSRGIGSRAI